LNNKQEQIALYYQLLDIKALKSHKYNCFRALLATTKFRQKFYRTAINKNRQGVFESARRKVVKKLFK